MSKYLIFLSALFLLTCKSSERIWSNPNDPEIAPAEWAPSNLQAQVLNDSEIKLTWEQEETRIAGFRVERSTGGTYTQIAEVGEDITEYTDTGLNYGADYTYRVKAFTDLNESDYAETTVNFWRDCNEEWNGSAFENACEYCVGGNTGIDENNCGTITDIDGNEYETILIGDQVWMAENLKVTHYRNREAISTKHNQTEWLYLLTGAYAVFNDNVTNATTYGYLYNWYAVDDSRNIAPEGWHVPTDDEWQTLVDYLGGESVAGGKLKEAGTSHWSSPNTGATNESGFTALPGGYRYGSIGNFYDMGNYDYFWSSTEYGSFSAWARLLGYDTSVVGHNGGNKRYGFSVRCVRD